MNPDDDILLKSRADVFTFEGKEINYYAKALEEMAETGQVVLIEAMRKSRYKEMYQEVISCREHQLPVLGTIVVGI